MEDNTSLVAFKKSAAQNSDLRTHKQTDRALPRVVVSGVVTVSTANDISNIMNFVTIIL